MNASHRFLVKRWLAIGLFAAIMLLLPTFASAAPVTLTFDQDATGADVLPGQVLDDEWNTPDFGNLIISWAETGIDANYPVVAFDSAAPTGGDDDLGSPNELCITDDFPSGGGPGVGDGGWPTADFPNCEPLGMLVILEENCTIDDIVDGFVDYTACGVPGPDDSNFGGLIAFTFGTTVEEQVEIESFELLDFEDAAGVEVTAFSFDGTEVGSFIAPAIGDNGSAVVDVTFPGSGLPWTDVSRVEFDLAGSGSVGTLSYITQVPTAIGLDTIGVRSDAAYYGIVAFLTLAALSLTSVAYLRQELLAKIRP